MRSTTGPTEYSAFELLFGRSPRMHLTFLKELWSGKQEETETKITYQNVIDLQNKIKETCEFAQSELAKVRMRNQCYFNKNAKLRKFEVNDLVWVINSRDTGKLGFNWSGPCKVIQKLSNVRYKIKFEDGNQREYHVNMIKSFVERSINDNCTVNSPNDQNKVVQQGEDQTGLCAALMGVVEIDEDKKEINKIDSDNYSGQNSIKVQEDVCDLPLPNTIQKETWKDVTVNPN
jgi:hypothetical protein